MATSPAPHFPAEIATTGLYYSERGNPGGLKKVI